MKNALVATSAGQVLLGIAGRLIPPGWAQGDCSELIGGSTVRSAAAESAAPPAQMEGLREENEALMAELVLKKMALAELSESYARVKRDLHRCRSGSQSGNVTEMQSEARPSQCRCMCRGHP